LQILIDGFSLGELDIKWLRERIGYVGQVLHLPPELMNSSKLKDFPPYYEYL
jgi:ABC-type proline/glycine betaine transport system ATPase subunit